MEKKEIAKKDRGEATYMVAGQEVKLTYQIVRDFLTKGNGDVSDQDLTQFISICRYNLLNPFLNEAYLVKYGTSPAQMIVSKEALMKRAEANPEYEGFKAGIIIMRGDDVVEAEGSLILPTDTLVGGWAEVYRTNKKPTLIKVSLKEYDKNQSTWKTMPATMIRKVAVVQALREAFPSQLGAMYTQEEVQAPTNIQDVEYVDITDKKMDQKIDAAEERKAQLKAKQTTNRPRFYD